MTESLALNFSQTVREGTLIFEMRGAIESLQSLDLVVESALQAGEKYIIVLLTDVDFINSTGFGALVRLSDMMSQQGKKIFFVGLQTKVHLVFHSLGGLHFFNVLPTLEEAFKAVETGQ
jgi:anti-anti-sigma factor